MYNLNWQTKLQIFRFCNWFFYLFEHVSWCHSSINIGHEYLPSYKCVFCVGLNHGCVGHNCGASPFSLLLNQNALTPIDHNIFQLKLHDVGVADFLRTLDSSFRGRLQTAIANSKSSYYISHEICTIVLVFRFVFVDIINITGLMWLFYLYSSGLIQRYADTYDCPSDYKVTLRYTDNIDWYKPHQNTTELQPCSQLLTRTMRWINQSACSFGNPFVCLYIHSIHRDANVIPVHLDDNPAFNSGVRFINTERLTEIRVLISNYIHRFQWDVITHPRPNFNRAGIHCHRYKTPWQMRPVLKYACAISV